VAPTVLELVGVTPGDMDGTALRLIDATRRS